MKYTTQDIKKANPCIRSRFAFISYSALNTAVMLTVIYRYFVDNDYLTRIPG